MHVAGSLIVPYRPDFEAKLADYCRQIGEAQSRNWHHDQRRALFMGFLKDAFGVEASEVELEHKIKAAKLRGYIDALYETTIFEFKSDFEREREAGLGELKRYLRSRPNSAEFIAVLTDGERFEVYRWAEGELPKIDAFKISGSEPRETYLRIDQFMKSERPRTPTSFDLVMQFGPHSVVYHQASALMRQLYDAVSEIPSVATKFREWNKLLAKVYGSELGQPGLFITHTYLVILSRLMVAQALFRKDKRDARAYRGVMSGEYFSRKRLPNLAEPDFFSWALDTPAEGDFTGLVSALEKSLAKFDFTETEEDILKELYQGLVDPEDRHELGEYYTPDWLAELILEKLEYAGGTLLDPSCGSGTFLMCAIRRLRGAGLRKEALVESVARDLAGIDVHPLAVLMAKANVLLALGADARGFPGEIRLPVFMADTLQTELDEGKAARCLKIPAAKGAVFHIPLESIERSSETLDQLIEAMQEYAHRIADDGADLESSKKGFLRNFSFLEEAKNGEAFYWRQNIETAAKLVKQKKNSIWAFILKNSYRPTYLRRRKARFIVGNPPWLSFRYIKDAEYKKRVKDLIRELGLADKRASHLTTQMDLSTVFYRYCESTFLAPGGKMGLVLPRSTIIGAKQHALFQEQGGFSRIIDCEAVEGLFNVPACAILAVDGLPASGPIPSVALAGRVAPRNADWRAARKLLEIVATDHQFVTHEVRSPWYRDAAMQGATIVPRAFWFVEIDPDAKLNPLAPYLRSNTELLKEAKDVWKRQKIKLDGQIEAKYLYYTVLARGLLPFEVRSVEPVFIPCEKSRGGGIDLRNSDELLAAGDRSAAAWLLAAEKIWNKYRKATHRSLIEWLDYNNKLSMQKIGQKHVVIYNTSGTNLTACAMNIDRARKHHAVPLNGFLADAKTYYFYADSQAHADYLCTALNSEPVMEAIKETMPRGLMGERDIHRRPFEACRIPLFDPRNALHQNLARLGEVCRKKASKIAEKLEGAIGRARKEMRTYLADELGEINRLAAQLIRDNRKKKPKPKPRKGGSDLFSP